MSTFLQIGTARLNICNYNNEFLILNSEDRATLKMFGKTIFEKQFDFIDDVIVTEVEICLKINSNFNYSKLGLLQNIKLDMGVKVGVYKMPVYFKDHDDWYKVETVTGFSKAEIIAKFKVTNFSIAMFGFLPGFLYLEGLESSLHIPRKPIPAKYIQANSLAIGGRYLGLYTLDSPGGWHVIGQTPLSILQMSKLPPVLLNLGDKFKLCPIEKDEYTYLLARQLTLKDYNA